MADAAIVGLACRLPGADSPRAFHDLLMSGEHAITPPPSGRGLTREAGHLPDIAAFDPAVHGISAREAELMDPHQRLALDLASAALDDAAVDRGTPDVRVGVWVGAMSGGWDGIVAHRMDDPHYLTGTQRSMIANGISRRLGLTGPSVLVDTGQSSSLAAVHTAVRALESGECDIAVVGGVNLFLTDDATDAAHAFGALSPTRRSRPFDAEADGYVRGEGGAFIVLRRTQDATAAGDRVYAVVAGSAMTNDGPGSATGVPNPAGQAACLSAALEDAGIGPDDLDALELHGTGTRVGDPAEADALGRVMGGRTAPLPVGSAKATVGHLEPAAGITGLVKMAMALHTGTVPAQAGFTAPHPALRLDEQRLRVLTEPLALPSAARAGVSSFGMGGTNCHVVLATAPRPDVDEAPRTGGEGRLVWLVSGAREGSLEEQAEALTGLLDDLADRAPAEHAGADVRLGTISSHLGARAQSGGRFRAAVRADDEAQLREGLRALAQDRVSATVSRGRARGGMLAGVFSGQGAQRPGMGLELAAAHPVFRSAYDEMIEVMSDRLGTSLDAVIRSGDRDLLADTRFTQTSLVAFEVAAHRLLASWGVVPDVLLGHSIGELAAAHVAGVLDVEDVATLAAGRGLAMAELPGGGGMLACEAPAPRVRDVIDGAGEQSLEIAVVNSPDSCVVAGPLEALARLEERAASTVRTARLRVSHAFHSAAMDPATQRFREVAQSVTHQPARTPIISTMDGEPRRLFDAEHWVAHLRRPVRFADAVTRAAADGAVRFLEVGPRASLVDAITRTIDTVRATALLGAKDETEPAAALDAVTALHLDGQPVAWTALLGRPRAGGVVLPERPERRRRLWPEAPAHTERQEQDAEVGSDPAAPEDDRPATARRILAAESPDAGRDLAVTTVADCLAAVLRESERPAVEDSFLDLGLTSQLVPGLLSLLTDRTGVALRPVEVFDHPTPQALGLRLHDLLTGASAAGSDRSGTGDGADEDPIAVVGMACRFPGASTPGALWDLLVAGGEATGPFPADRGWDLDDLFDDDPDAPGRSYCREGGFIADATTFDAAMFGISAREAEAMDPQQRKALETAWEALESAGIDPTGMAGERAGVFVGAMPGDYGPPMTSPSAGEGYRLTGTHTSVISGRIAYQLGLRGPALSIDTACSSSLVALHSAIRSLRSGESSLAVAGGVTIMSTPGMFVELTKQRAISRSGRCRAFSDDADGTGWAEGCGMVVLERLSSARAAGRRVLGVLTGSATNQDGASNGLTAPNGAAQQQVIRDALADAGLEAHDVDVVEAHGTGTRLGDPIEAHALLETYGRRDAQAPALRLGSLKSNIGHTQAAAGVGGLIKILLALEHDLLPPTVHVTRPSTRIDWDAGRVELLTRAEHWPAGDRPRRAGVSSFGISGTNAHLIVEEPPAAEVPAGSEVPSRSATEAGAVPLLEGAPVPLPFTTGPAPEALAAEAEAIRDWMGPRADDELRAASAALAARSSRLPQRGIALATDPTDAQEALSALVAGTPDPRVETGGSHGRRRIAFVFPGQGSAWHGMGAELYLSAPVFAQHVDRCEDLFAPHLDWSVRDAIRGLTPERPSTEANVQPLLFTMMTALAQLWRAAGVEPAAVVGHSQGEAAAAWIAGALTLEDAVEVIMARSTVWDLLPEHVGAMASVNASPQETEDMLAPWADQLGIAAINTPGVVVVSGDPRAMEEFASGLEEHHRFSPLRSIVVAGHSPVLEPVRPALAESMRDVVARSPRIPVYSTVTGDRLDQRMEADYWCRNVIGTVRFADAVSQMIEDGFTTFVQISPHPILQFPLEQLIDGRDGLSALATIRRGEGTPADAMRALARAYAAGVDIDWDRVVGSPAEGAAALAPPPRAFVRTRHWLAEEQDARHGWAVDLPDGGWAGARRATADELEPGALDDERVLRADAPLALALETATDLGSAAVSSFRITGLPVQSVDGELRLLTQVEAPRDGIRAATISGRAESADEVGAWVPVAHFDLHSSPGAAARRAGAEDTAAPGTASGAARGTPGAPWEVWRDAPQWGRGTALRGILEERGPGQAVAVDLLTMTGGTPERVRWRAETPTDRDTAAAEGQHTAEGQHSAAVDRVDVEARGGDDSVVLRAHGVELVASVGHLVRGRRDPLLWEPVLVPLGDADPADPAAGHSRLRDGSTADGSTADGSIAAGATSGISIVDWGRAAQIADATGWVVGRPDAPVQVLCVPPATGPSVADAEDGIADLLAQLRNRLAAESDVDSVLVVVTAGDDLVAAGVRGLVRSAQAEHPDRIRLIDADRVTGPALGDAVAAGRTECAIRGGEVLAPSLAPLEAREWTPPAGTILITGATGALGARAAVELADRGAADLLLVSRSGGDTDAAAALTAQLDRRGTPHRFVACDVADPDAVSDMVARAQARGPIRGVVHTAGALDDGLLHDMDAARLRVTTAAKVRGAENLDAALVAAHAQTDFFACYSSVIGLLGGPGQATYAAANAMLDAWCRDRAQRRGPTTAIAWSVWDVSTGLTDLGAVELDRFRRRGLIPLTDDDGPTALGRAVGTRATEVVAARLDHSVLARSAHDPEQPARLRSLGGGAEQGSEAGLDLIVRLQSTPPAEREQELTAHVLELASDVLRGLAVDDVDPGLPYRDLGFDSLTGVELRNRLARAAGVPLPTTLVFDHPTPRATAVFVLEQLDGVLGSGPQPEGEPGAGPLTESPVDPSPEVPVDPVPQVSVEPAPQADATEAQRSTGARDERVIQAEVARSAVTPPRADAHAPRADADVDDPIVIVSTACRLPGGVSSADDLWRLVAEGREGVGPFPDNRGWPDDLHDPQSPGSSPSITGTGGFLYEADAFDSAFFRVSPREATAMDPQQRLLLETGWELLERGGIVPADLAGEDVGVYIGTIGQTYTHGLHGDPELEGHLVTGGAASVLSGRLAYHLGLTGPAVSVDTACSSSLVALHLAAQALRTGDCDLAIAGGVTVMSRPDLFVGFSRQGGLAADGRCKSFADAADGTAWGEGVSLLLVERLSRARAHDHTVLAVVESTAINQDGASNGLSAPSGAAQQSVIRSALRRAGLTASDVDLVEAHGTGTSLGDPIEAQAVLATYGQRTGDPVWLGSLKSNIAHTQGAAGAAGVIKITEAMRHGIIPPTLHVDAPSTAVDWTAGRVALVTEPVRWTPGDRVRRAAVSAFGISGTNAHVILAEPPAEDAAPSEAAPSRPALGHQVLPLSAMTAPAVREYADALGTELRSAADPGAVARTMATARTRFAERAVVWGTDTRALLDGLDAVARDATAPGVARGTALQGDTTFWFSGQGTQRVGMGRGLSAASPVFAQHCREALEACGTPRTASWDDALDDASLLHRTEIAQPAIFAFEVALARTLMSLGLVPQTVGGHSIGEIAAAHIAGVLDLEEAAALVTARGRLMQALPAGAMLAVETSEDRIQGLIAGTGADIAAVNAHDSVVLSGTPAAIDAAAQRIGQDVRSTRLRVSHAFHSSMMEPMLAEFADVVEGLTFREPVLRTVSSTRPGDAADHWRDPAYWVRHVRETVRFAEAVGSDPVSGTVRHIEVGPSAALTPALSTLAPEAAVVPTQRSRQDEVGNLLAGLAAAHCAGAELDWDQLIGSGARASAPTYPFQRRSFWRSWSSVRPGEDARGAEAPPASDSPGAPHDGPRILTPVWEAAPGPLTGTVTATVTSTETRTDRASAGGDPWWVIGSTGDSAAAQAIAAALADHGASARVLQHPGDTASGDSAARDTASGETASGDISADLSALPAGARIVSLTTLTGAVDESGVPDGVREALALLRSCRENGHSLHLLTGGATPRETVGADSSQASVWALARVMLVEAGGVLRRVIDVEPGALEHPERRHAVALLAGALVREDAEPQMRVHEGALEVPRLVPRDLPSAPLDVSGGAVLITGGTGGLGLSLARAAATAGAEDIVLLSRSGENAESRALADEQRTRGVRVRTVACDVADRASVDALARDLDGTRIGTLVHAAGVVEFRALEDIRDTDLAAGMAAKTDGLENLLDIVGTPPTVVLYSSIAAAWGSAHQGVYAAANGWLDGAAARLRARGVRAVSVSWGPWAEVGMIRGGGVEERLARQGLRAMSEEDALDALARVLSGDLTHAVIADVDWDRFFEIYDLAGHQPLLDPMRDAPPPDDAESDDEAAEHVWQGLTHDEVAQRLRVMVRGEVAGVLAEPDTTSVDLDVPFRDLGFDSVMAVDLRDRLGRVTGLRIETPLVFDRPTVHELADEIASRIVIPPVNGTMTTTAPTTTAAATTTPPASAATDLDDIDDADELLRYLDSELGGTP